MIKGYKRKCSTFVQLLNTWVSTGRYNIYRLDRRRNLLCHPLHVSISFSFWFQNLNSTNGIYLLRSKKPLVVQYWTGFYIWDFTLLHTQSCPLTAHQPIQKVRLHEFRTKTILISRSKKSQVKSSIKVSDVRHSEDPWPVHQGAW